MPTFSEELDDYFARYLAYFNYKNYSDRLNLNRDDNVLELGSGGGNLSRFLAKKILNGELTCIDNSEFWLDKSNTRLRDFNNINYKLEDIQQLNLNNKFNAIVLHYVLHDLSDRELVMNIISSHLKNRGKLFIREPIRKSHGIPISEIEELTSSNNLEKLSSWQGCSFPIRGQLYEGIFKKK